MLLKKMPADNEWNVKSILIRLLMYPACIALIVLGYYMIFEPSTVGTIWEGRTRIAGFLAILLACICPYADIKILAQKRNERRRKKNSKKCQPITNGFVQTGRGSLDGSANRQR
jgi:hypothetical protein